MRRRWPMSSYTQLLTPRNRRLIQLHEMIEWAEKHAHTEYARDNLTRWRGEYAGLKLQDSHERLAVVR